MLKLGEWNELQVMKEKDFGVYLGIAGEKEEVLLPVKQVPKGTKIGDVLNVFIYRDSSDRIIATVNMPDITL
jgi:hypothetical protein